MHRISVWFVCKLCRSSYQQVPDLIKHKFECHFEQFKSIKQIIFEERLDDNFFNFSDEGTVPSPEPCLDTQVKEERELGSYRAQSLNYPRSNILYNKLDEEVVADENPSFTNPGPENITKKAVTFTIENDSVTINVGILNELDSAANNPNQITLTQRQRSATDSKDLQDAEIEVTPVSANLIDIPILTDERAFVPSAPALTETPDSKLSDANPINLNIVSIEDASTNITFDSDHDPNDILETESNQSDTDNTICKAPSETTTNLIDSSSIKKTNDVSSSLDFSSVTHGGILSSRKNPFVFLRRLSQEEIEKAKLDQKRVSQHPVVDVTREAPCFESDSDELNFSNDETRFRSDSETDPDFDLKPFKLKKRRSIPKQKQFTCPHRKCEQIFKSQFMLTRHLNNYHGVNNLRRRRLMICTSPTPTNTSNNEENSNTTPELSLAHWLTNEAETVNANGTPNVIRLDPDPTTMTEQDALLPISRLNPIKCKLCGRRLISESDVKKHVSRCWRHNKLQLKYCVPCSRSFRSTAQFRQHNFRKHLSTEEKIAEARFKCDLCPKVFYVSGEFKIHTETHKSKEEQQQRKPFVCEICGYTFIYIGMLERHIASTHSNVRHFKCPLENCSKAFKTKTGFDLHMRIVHSHIKPFKCSHPNCGKSFKRKHDLGTHALLHQGKRRRPHQTFRCSQDNCDSSFQVSLSLTRHLKVVHNIGPERERFPCTVCNKLCSSKSYLQRHHIIVHTQDFPFKCTIEGCSAAFKLKERLVQHERVHNGQKYLCTVCGKSYSIYISFHKHQLSHRKTANANVKKNRNTSKGKEDDDNSSISDASSND